MISLVGSSGKWTIFLILYAEWWEFREFDGPKDDLAIVSLTFGREFDRCSDPSDDLGWGSESFIGIVIEIKNNSMLVILCTNKYQ